MKFSYYIIKIGYLGLITHIRNCLSLYFPNIFSSRPQAIDILPTLRCNLRCKQCNIWKIRPKDKELSTDQWKEIIINLKKWLGPFNLRIIGSGEPLLRKDLVDIIKFSHQQEIFTVLNTNGTLITKKIASDIAESGLDLICISLDSLKQERYDYLRGVVGTYRKVMQALELLKDRMNNVQINTTIMSYNLDELIDLVEFCEDNKVAIAFQGIQNSKIRFCNCEDIDFWPKEKSKINKIFNELMIKRRKGETIRNSIGNLQLLKSYFLDPQRFMDSSNYRCLAYIHSFRIRFNGVVKLCHYFDPVGNVAIIPPQKIWRSKEAFRVRGKIKKCRRNCSFIRCCYYENLLEKIEKFKNFAIINTHSEIR